MARTLSGRSPWFTRAIISTHAAVGLARHSTERNSEGWQLDHSGSVSASDEHDPVGAPSAMRSWSAVVSSVGVLAYVVSLPSPQSPPACRA